MDDLDTIYFKSIKNLHSVSLIFFFILGLLHFISGMLFNNGYLQNVTYLINNSVDIPFALSATIYLLSSIKFFLLNKNFKSNILDKVLIIIFIFVFISLIYFNLFTPDKKI